MLVEQMCQAETNCELCQNAKGWRGILDTSQHPPVFSVSVAFFCCCISWGIFTCLVLAPPDAWRWGFCACRLPMKDPPLLCSRAALGHHWLLRLTGSVTMSQDNLQMRLYRQCPDRTVLTRIERRVLISLKPLNAGASHKQRPALLPCPCTAAPLLMSCWNVRSMSNHLKGSNSPHHLSLDISWAGWLISIILS